MTEAAPIRISNSEIQVYKDCKRRWWLSYYRRLRPNTSSYTGALALGSRIHAALDNYYANDVPLLEAHVQLVAADREKLEAEFRDTFDLDAEADLGRIMLEGYLEWVEENGIDAELEMISTEEIIEMPLLDGKVILQGKIDMRVRRKADGVRMFRDFKAQPLSEPVATPQGWSAIGDLKKNDFVLGSDFQPVRVIGTYDLGEDVVYKITFNDGSFVRASGDHYWTIERLGKTITVTTKELNALSYVRDRIKPIITIVEEDSLDTDFKLHPYVLGAWIGDGVRSPYFRSNIQLKTDEELSWRARIGIGSVEVANEISKHTGAVVVKSKDIRYKSDFYGVNPNIGNELKKLGLVECYSKDRFIPAAYLRSSYNQRLELLKGLMDTDGAVGTHQNTVYYLTMSERLANDVAELVRSLGGWSRVTKGITPTGYTMPDGTKVSTGNFAWRVSIRVGVNPFGFNKKRLDSWEQWQASSRTKRRPRLEFARDKLVNSVVEDGKEQVRCIKVEAADSLYITRGLTLTHNTVGGSFTDFAALAHMNEQIMTYMLLETAQNKAGERSEGGIFTLLKKVKRTAKAAPPFYEQIEVRHNIFTMRSFWQRMHGVLYDMVDTREALDAGGDHRFVAYPHATKDCKWKCSFFTICPMFDDGSAAEAVLEDKFTVGNPYAYYGSDPDEKKGNA